MLLIPQAQQSKAAAPQYIKRTQSQREFEKAVFLWLRRFPHGSEDERNVFNNTGGSARNVDIYFFS